VLGVTSAVAGWAPSIYHALQVKIEKRYSKGFTLLVSYTYSKLMDFSTGPFNGETLGGGAIQDWNNLRREYAASSLDQTHRLVVNTVYGLPFLKDQKGVAGHLFGGWEMGVVGTFYSGSPLGIASAVNGTNSLGGSQRPNWNGQNPGIGDRLRINGSTRRCSARRQRTSLAPRLGRLRARAAIERELSISRCTRTPM
jgi:hypothetical protein